MIILISITLLTSTAVYIYGSEDIILTSVGFEECSTCHSVSGAHIGIGCGSCHVIGPEYLNLSIQGVPHGEFELYWYENSSIPYRLSGESSDRHNIVESWELNEFCGSCHNSIYVDYILLAHGNTTYIVDDEDRYVVNGYKGVNYILHIAPDYTNLRVVNARACVECHDPHDPLMTPPSILPVQSYRPPPPDQRSISLYGLTILLISLMIIVYILLRR
jgi:hypothetical protein